MSRVDSLLPIQDVSLQFGISQDTLLELVDQGIIKAAVLPGGDVAVDLEDARLAVLNTKLQSINRIDFDYLSDSWIVVAEAEQKYNVPSRTINQWVHNHYIRKDSRSYRASINEADLAYCVVIHKVRKAFNIKRGGTPLLDESGAPHLVKTDPITRKSHRQIE